jgi:hypothetical protein
MFIRLILIAAIAYAAYEFLKFIFPENKKITSKNSSNIKKNLGVEEEDIRDAEFQDLSEDGNEDSKTDS